jgi:hypothetical protein
MAGTAGPSFRPFVRVILTLIETWRVIGRRWSWLVTGIAAAKAAAFIT